MAHPAPSTSAACGGRLRCRLPHETFRTKMSDLYKQVDLEAMIRPINRGRSTSAATSLCTISMWRRLA